MKLKDLLYKVHLQSIADKSKVAIKAVHFDSRKVTANSLFVAVKGTKVDGHCYINEAIELGATAIVCEKLPDTQVASISYIQTTDSALALGIISSNLYGNPSGQLKLIGVTGTNGKTSVVTLLYRLSRALGYSTGMLSTVENVINGEVILSSHTTPDAVSLNVLLANMVSKGCEFAFIEVSSHAIDQHRIGGLTFAGAVFMNISHDHLDYHGSFNHYIKTKKKLFDQLPSNAFALTNVDDKRGQIMLQNTKATTYTFGLKSLADYKVKIITNSYQGLELDLNGQSIWFRLIGKFNAYNLLAVYAIAELLGIPTEKILITLSGLASVPGRFEQVNTSGDIIAIVDYAHTPDALDNVLQAIHSFRTVAEKVITVVGCGGNRDRNKRPLMASIATKWSDKVIFTDDNPRDEESKDILDQMMQGVGKSYLKKTLVIPDRKEAIKTACAIAQPHDIILVAGKGHESYQEVKGERFDFDDRVILKEMLTLFSN